ncbi:MAG: pyruvate kinase [Nitrococcus sp.]|nr:pyruvate kinase [Nitrococcus sp.]
MVRQTKIVATLGPATDREGALAGVLRAGVDVVRLNLSHGNHAEHRQRSAALRGAAQRHNRVVGLLCDLQGPKIRVGRFRDGIVELVEGQAFFLDPSLAKDAGTENGCGVGYAGLPQDVDPGDVLLLNDGLIRLRVDRVEGCRIFTVVEIGGTLSDHKGINQLGGGLSVRALTDKDHVDIQLAAELEADYLAVSFPKGADDIEEARELLRAAGGHAAIVAKIERREAVDNLSEIMEAADAVMIARGDLAVEIGDAELPGVQKRIMRLARERDCVVITATQMMQSMVNQPVPTRAEVLDVANAVLDGTDAVMLSEESAVGRFPARAVAAMARVCLGAERYAEESRPPRLGPEPRYTRIDETIAKTAIAAANQLSVRAIAAMTESGATAMWMSRISTDIPIYALSEQTRTLTKVTLYRGVHPINFDPAGRGDHTAANRGAVEELLGAGAIREGDLVLITQGDLAGVQGGTNTMKIVRVGDPIPDSA